MILFKGLTNTLSKSRVSSYSESSRFRHFAMDLVDCPKGYEWGKENDLGADCSGSVCYALLKMGYNIRTTADGLYKHIFTRTISVPDWYRFYKDHYNDMVCAFYISTVPWEKLSGTKMPAGTARHIAPLVGPNVIVQASYARDALYLSTPRAPLANYPSTTELVYRAVNIESLRKHSEAKDMLFGLDKEMS